VNQDHVPAGELFAARHLLPDELAVMNHKLDIEALHPAAGLALATAGLLDAAKPLAERKIGLFDRVLHQRSIDLVGKRVHEAASPSNLARRKGGRSTRTSVFMMSAMMSWA
jgi:hypothetical protein